MHDDAAVIFFVYFWFHIQHYMLLVDIGINGVVSFGDLSYYPLLNTFPYNNKIITISYSFFVKCERYLNYIPYTQ